MKRVVVLLGTALLALPAMAADPEGFAMWRASELQQRDEALSRRVGPDRSARETLADFGQHRVRLLYRDADGVPEQHDNIVDVVLVQSGEGTLVVGGRMLGLRSGSSAGEFLGTDIEGGERHALAAGDLIHIPAAVPHRFLVPAGTHLTYVLVKFPTR